MADRESGRGRVVLMKAQRGERQRETAVETQDGQRGSKTPSAAQEPLGSH